MAIEPPVYGNPDAVEEMLALLEQEGRRDVDAGRFERDWRVEASGRAKLAAVRAYRFASQNVVPPEWLPPYRAAEAAALRRADREAYDQYLALKARFEAAP